MIENIQVLVDHMLYLTLSNLS